MLCGHIRSVSYLRAVRTRCRHNLPCSAPAAIFAMAISKRGLKPVPVALAGLGALSAVSPKGSWKPHGRCCPPAGCLLIAGACVSMDLALRPSSRHNSPHARLQAYHAKKTMEWMEAE